MLWACLLITCCCEKGSLQGLDNQTLNACQPCHLHHALCLHASLSSISCLHASLSEDKLACIKRRAVAACQGSLFVACIRYRLIAVCLTTSCGVLVCRISRKSALTSALLFTLLLLTTQKSVGQTLLARNNGGGSLLLHAA